jgi:hypothetical protein
MVFVYRTTSKRITKLRWEVGALRVSETFECQFNPFFWFSTAARMGRPFYQHLRTN